MTISNQASFGADELPALFNEWMRRYTEEPEKFEAEFRTVGEYLKEAAEGVEPSYGEHCAAYLLNLRDELAVGSAERASAA